jgi:hypothetical protein
LETFNGQVVARLVQLGEQAEGWVEVHRHDARRHLEYCELPRAGDVIVISTARCRGLHRMQLQEMLRCLWQREGWPQQEVTAEHWTTTAAVLHGFPKAIDLPGGVHVRRSGAVVQISHVLG